MNGHRYNKSFAPLAKKSHTHCTITAPHMQKFIIDEKNNYIVYILWVLGVIATADVPAVPPAQCNDAASDLKPVSCIYMPIIAAFPEDGLPPPGGRMHEE